MAPTYTYNENVGMEVLQAMRNSTQLIQSELAELDSYCVQHLAEWKGTAAENGYKVHSAAWNAAAGQMNGSLEKAGLALGRIGEGYGEADGYAARMWG